MRFVQIDGIGSHGHSIAGILVLRRDRSSRKFGNERTRVIESTIDGHARRKDRIHVDPACGAIGYCRIVSPLRNNDDETDLDRVRFHRYGSLRLLSRGIVRSALVGYIVRRCGRIDRVIRHLYSSHTSKHDPVKGRTLLKVIRRLVIVVALCLVLFPQSTFAASLFEHQDTTIPVNQTVEDVVVVGGDVSIAGTVKNAVVVVNGDVRFESTAVIKGAIVVIGGKLQQEEGATVTSDIVNIAFDDATSNSLIIGAGLIIGLSALKLCASIVMVVLPVLLVLFGKRRAIAFAERYRIAPRGKLLAIGFFAGLLLVAASMMLLLTIVGIPLILLLAILFAAALALGLTVVGVAIGERIRFATDKAAWVKCAAGAVILISMMNVPIIGLFIYIALALFSLGVATSWTFSKMKWRKDAK